MMKTPPKPKDAKHLFSLGYDTVEIARLLRITEAEAARLLMIARDNRDSSDAQTPTLRKPVVALRRERRPPFAGVSGMDDGGGMADPGAGKKRED